MRSFERFVQFVKVWRHENVYDKVKNLLTSLGSQEGIQ